MKAKKVYENLNNILKPKTTKEITSNLNLVKSIDELVIGNYYYVLDLGMNVWMKDLEYNIENGLHVFDTTYFFDDFSIEYTTEELIDAINDGEIANDENI
jgi:hypothetical protein